MTCQRTAERYLATFEKAISQRGKSVALESKEDAPSPGSRLPPPMRLGHFFSMCDDTGLYRHAVHCVPDRSHGYCVDDNARALLLACAPPDARNLPIVVFFHGGAWINGHRGWLRFMAPAILRLPAIFVAGTYRVAPRCRWPAQYEDVRDALWCVEHHAQALGGDPQRMVIGGHSAGAHLASLVTLKHDTPPLLGAFPVSGSHDLQYGPVSWESPEGRIYKYLFVRPEQDYDASPINFVASNTVRFHVTWGELDFPRVRDSSARFVRAMQSGMAQITTDVLSGASHFDCDLALADGQHPWYGMLKDTLYGPREFRVRGHNLRFW